MSEQNEEGAAPPDKLQAIGRGLVFKCPNCGKGKLFRGFLTLVDRCEECDEPLGRFEPDLLLALLVGLVVVTVVAVIFFVAEIAELGGPLIYITLLFPISTAVTFLVLRPFKGGLVGLMWAFRLHEPDR